MKGKISGVSLGPGEPELITLKALKALQEADIIYCPGTQTKSRSRDILQALPINMERVRLFHVPMSKDRTLANQTYDSICTEIAALVATGKNIAITAEGDSGFYSSVNYMFDKLASMNLPITTIAGVPAFIVADVGAGRAEQPERHTLHGAAFPGFLCAGIQQRYGGTSEASSVSVAGADRHGRKEGRVRCGRSEGRPVAPTAQGQAACALCPG